MCGYISINKQGMPQPSSSMEVNLLCISCVLNVAVWRLNANVKSAPVSSCYSGTSLLRSPTGLDGSDLNGEVTLLQGVICIVEYNLGLSQGDCN